MKATTANPETIREVFSKRSWDNEECEKLWDDIFLRPKGNQGGQVFFGEYCYQPSFRNGCMGSSGRSVTPYNIAVAY